MNTQDAELCTAIILATEDTFRRKFRGEVTEGRKALACLDLMATPSIERLLLANRTMQGKSREQAFVALVKTALSNHPLYSVAARSKSIRGKDPKKKPEKGEKVDVIMRKCQFEMVKNKAALADYVYAYAMTGVFVDDELLNYSYPAVARDIDSLVAENVMLRMPLIGKAPENCFLFPNLEEQFGLSTGKENPFQQEYLVLCKQFTHTDERVFEEQSRPDIKMEINESDPNYRLPGFLALKTKWKIKETAKVMAQEEEDLKAKLEEQKEAERQHAKKPK
jgi:hypothetical protein